MKCTFCYYKSLTYSENNSGGNNQELDLSIDVLETKISKIKCIDKIFLTGGEPLLHPQLKDIIKKLQNRVKNIYVCTNALLIDDVLIKFFRVNHITLIISLKEDTEKIFKMLKFFHDCGLNIELYHVLQRRSIPIIMALSKKYSWVKKVRLLLKTSSDPNKNVIDAEEWITLLQIARHYLRPIISKIEAEVGFVPLTHDLAKQPNKGAVNRIVIDYNGKCYHCPLIVEKNNGVENIEDISTCDVNKCPVIKKSSNNYYQQVCPFNIVQLNELESKVTTLK
jgi:sulfatase maturation enzyme AslB (radical SAM superfamily)